MKDNQYEWKNMDISLRILKNMNSLKHLCIENCFGGENMRTKRNIKIENSMNTIMWIYTSQIIQYIVSLISWVTMIVFH
jgi:hypothetical protein